MPESAFDLVVGQDPISVYMNDPPKTNMSGSFFVVLGGLGLLDPLPTFSFPRIGGLQPVYPPGLKFKSKSTPPNRGTIWTKLKAQPDGFAETWESIQTLKVGNGHRLSLFLPASLSCVQLSIFMHAAFSFSKSCRRGVSVVNGPPTKNMGGVSLCFALESPPTWRNKQTAVRKRHTHAANCPGCPRV